MELPKELEELMQIAVNEALGLQAEAIELIHLFIAACKQLPPSVAAAFQASGIDPQELRRRMRAYADAASAKHAAGLQRISAQASHLLELARGLATTFNRPLNTAWVLSALLMWPDDGLRRALEEEGVPCEQLNRELERGLVEMDAEAAPVVAIQFKHPPTPTLDCFGRDYTAMAREGNIGPVIGLREEIERVIHILLEKHKNYPILIGEARVSKTSIVEGLARYAVADFAPAEIRQMRIVELLLTPLVADTNHGGELEERLKLAVEEAESDPQLIVFLNEIHMLVGAGSSHGSSLDAANILKLALEHGRIRCIGATSTDEYQRYIESDPALERRFQPVRIEEPTPAEALEILIGLRPTYEAQYGVKITDGALEAAVLLSVKYLPDRRLPDWVHVLINSAASLRRPIRQMPGIGVVDKDTEVTADDIVQQVALWAGIPVDRLTADARQSAAAQLEESLRQRDEIERKAAEAAQAALNDALCRAVKDDDLEAVAKALKEGADGELAYYEALLHGNAEIVKLLLDRGMDPNAAVSSHDESYYIRVNGHLRSFSLPLVIAMLKGHNDVVRLLLERGAYPNCEYSFGWSKSFSVKITPLGQAIKAGDLDLVKLLLEKGAGASSVWRSGDSDDSGVSAQVLAGRMGMQEISDLLEEREKARAERERTRPETQEELNDALYDAVHYGILEAAEGVLKKGADANYERDESDYSKGSYYKMPVLYMACASQNAEMVKLLLAHGAKPYASFYNSPSVEESSLKSCLTAAMPNVEITRLLLEAGLSPDSEDGWKERDWHYESISSKAEQRSKSDPAYLEIVNLFKEYANKSKTDTGWELMPKENTGGEDKENS